MPWSPSAAAQAALVRLKQYLADAGFPALQNGTAPGGGIPQEALFDAFQLGAVHALGGAVAWTPGAVGTGKYALPAAPNASGLSVVGSDEAGKITFTAGANTTAGNVFTLRFGAPFPNPPAFVVAPANANAAHLFYSVEWSTTSMVDDASLVIASAGLANVQYAFFWMAKGWQ